MNKRIKRAGVLGLGKSGIAAANLAVKLGYEVFGSDSGKERKIKNLDKQVVKEFGVHTDKILSSDFIIKSPGIHSDIKILKKAKKNKVPVISELDFSLNHSRYKKLIAVTGTNGKTTTTDLLSKIIKAAHKDSIVTGNIGFPLSDKALSTTKNTFVTMELSSYQLEDSPSFRPDISVLLNITPDHLEHHKTMRRYAAAKENILKNQRYTDFSVINADDKICKKISSSTKAVKVFFGKKTLKNGVYFDSGSIVINIKNKKSVIKPKICIPGMHNVENILAATAAAYCAGIKVSVIEKVVSSYKGVEHRIEFVRKINGVGYYNDSKSTNVDSTRVALESFKENILLIMGGLDKGAPYTPLKDLVKSRVKRIYLIGEAAQKIKKDLKGASFINSGTVENALKDICKTAESGDTVLLSPACASFDQFKNFEERGKFFKSIIKTIGHV
ncbi:MAG: UDP-N-acetylmuramoyl-L-alanine--D-glutamate ligase [Endomicrobium sp.]|jgi:UDP-N-acetylmuramoylalanine--D-glutamate ligase|nr:UDP-N-acetylmuramoyl-L-alanine--D-glutamate ligase [Endomicrobium sp.]